MPPRILDRFKTEKARWWKGGSSKAALRTGSPTDNRGDDGLQAQATTTEPVNTVDKQPQAQQQASDVPDAQPCPPRAFDSEMLWREAYNGLSQSLDTAELVKQYENILDNAFLGNAKALDGNRDAAASPLVSNEGPLAGEEQLKKMVEIGLNNIKKAKSATEVYGKIFELATPLQAVLNPAMSNNPQTALPWAVVSASLEILAHPAKVTRVLYTGVEYVVTRMTWYSSLAESLLANRADLKRSRVALEKSLIHLYQMLLHYQMRSICFFYRNQVVVFLRALALVDDWPGDLQSVIEAEESLRKDAEQYTNNKSSDLLARLVDAGEAATRHQAELKQAEEERSCLIDVRSIDPRIAMIDLQNRKKDHFVAACFQWILRDEHYKKFTQWQQADPPRLLWINGQAGKGKTMLMIGIIQEITRSQLLSSDTPDVLYFFCQAGDNQMNTATAALKGLIWMLVQQQPKLIKYVLDLYKTSAGKMFHDTLSCSTLSDILSKMVKDPALQPAVLILDALDECEENSREQLIDAIDLCSSLSPKVKWIVSSRPLPTIERKLLSVRDKLGLLDIKLDEQDLREPILAYIDYKINHLPAMNDEEEKCRSEVKEALRLRAGDTFLWVWLICKQLKMAEAYEWMDLLDIMPDDLQELFNHLLEQLNKLKVPSTIRNCKRVLAVATLAFRPLSLSELAYMADLPSNVPPDRVVRQCGSFLTQQGDHVHLIHKSAQDYLITNFAMLGEGETVAMHGKLFGKCLQRLRIKLEENICQVDSYGTTRDEVDPSSLSHLDPVRYACRFWILHLEKASMRINDQSEVYSFLKMKLLPWIEAFSWADGMSEIMPLLRLLQSCVAKEQASKGLSSFLEDASWFLLRNRTIIERAPRQAYASALIFAPSKSIVRNTFRGHIPEWLARLPATRPQWDPEVLRLVHGGVITSIAFSANGDKMASATWGGAIKLWDLTSGMHRSLQTHDESYNTQVALSSDANLVASSSSDFGIKIWNAAPAGLICTLQGHTERITGMAFVADNQRLVSASRDGTTKIWDLQHRKEAEQQLEQHAVPVVAMVASPDNTQIASAYLDHTVKIWNMTTWEKVQELNCHDSSPLSSVVFLSNSARLATISDGCTLRHWDIAKKSLVKECIMNPELGSRDKMAISPNGELLAYSTVGGPQGLVLKNMNPHMPPQLLHQEGAPMWAIKFSLDGRLLASAGGDIRLWNVDLITDAVVPCPTMTGADADLKQEPRFEPALQHSCGERIEAIALSPTDRLLASSTNQDVLLWDLQSRRHPRNLPLPYGSFATAIAFSPDGKTLVYGIYGRAMINTGGITTWDLSSCEASLLSSNERSHVVALTFSPDSTLLASSYWNGEIYVQTANTGHTVRHFSPDKQYSEIALLGGVLLAWSPENEIKFDVPGMAEQPPPVKASPFTIVAEWVMRGSEKLFWLPPAYRTLPYAFGHDRVVFGKKNGFIETVVFRV
ncbi:hypothetical protein PRZ48_013218 [Zasmidium cellare]|uniref:NACHT domain-containing protein n=1 Tax=Zasmidium cellare TaxID=395010 RepID=A0ABR0E3F6_ZASCE|nr:hypothetical protein PRZ48_013218 [Zasmidium cellare]